MEKMEARGNYQPIEAAQNRGSSKKQTSKGSANKNDQGHNGKEQKDWGQSHPENSSYRIVQRTDPAESGESTIFQREGPPSAARSKSWKERLIAPFRRKKLAVPAITPRNTRRGSRVSNRPGSSPRPNRNSLHSRRTSPTSPHLSRQSTRRSEEALHGTHELLRTANRHDGGDTIEQAVRMYRLSNPSGTVENSLLNNWRNSGSMIASGDESDVESEETEAAEPRAPSVLLPDRPRWSVALEAAYRRAQGESEENQGPQDSSNDKQKIDENNTQTARTMNMPRRISDHHAQETLADFHIFETIDKKNRRRLLYLTAAQSESVKEQVEMMLGRLKPEGRGHPRAVWVELDNRWQQIYIPVGSEGFFGYVQEKDTAMQRQPDVEASSTAVTHSDTPLQAVEYQVGNPFSPRRRESALSILSNTREGTRQQWEEIVCMDSPLDRIASQEVNDYFDSGSANRGERPTLKVRFETPGNITAGGEAGQRVDNFRGTHHDIQDEDDLFEHRDTSGDSNNAALEESRRGVRPSRSTSRKLREKEKETWWNPVSREESASPGSEQMRQTPGAGVMALDPTHTETRRLKISQRSNNNTPPPTSALQNTFPTPHPSNSSTSPHLSNISTSRNPSISLTSQVLSSSSTPAHASQVQSNLRQYGQLYSGYHLNRLDRSTNEGDQALVSSDNLTMPTRFSAQDPSIHDPTDPLDPNYNWENDPELSERSRRYYRDLRDANRMADEVRDPNLTIYIFPPSCKPSACIAEERTRVNGLDTDSLISRLH